MPIWPVRVGGRHHYGAAPLTLRSGGAANPARSWARGSLELRLRLR